MSVPDRRFTYVPSALLENARDLESGAELRVVLAVLQKTWGWTHSETDPESDREEPVHDRWAQLSIGELAGDTGLSETAVAQAAKRLNGQWIERLRPGNGAYQYRFLPEAVGDGPEDSSSFSTGTANDLPPHRQNSGTPTVNKENSCRDKHRRQEEKADDSPSGEPSPKEPRAVPTENSSGKPAVSEDTGQTLSPNGEAPPPDFTDLPPEKQHLAEKLSNVGIWTGQIVEVLYRFSTERIRANFRLYRRRSAEQTIRSPGAWLYRAITDGYALPQSNQTHVSEAPNGTSLPSLEHKETISEEKMKAYVQRGVPKRQFHRCLSEEPGARYMYLDSSVGGPDGPR